MSKYIANLIVFFRVALIFIIVPLLNSFSLQSRITGLLLLVSAVILDWLDGYCARKFKSASLLGGMLDTLGDRITENLLLIFFAYKRLIPVYVPLIFVSRSLISDFIRYLYLSRGIHTFSINKSKLGMLMVASRPSRALYLVFKVAVFFLGGVILIGELVPEGAWLGLESVLVSLRNWIFYASILLVFFNLLRFILLIYDSRSILKEEFSRSSS